jgi:hypothetical protein
VMGKFRSSDRYPGGNHPCVHHAFRKGKFHSLSAKHGTGPLTQSNLRSFFFESLNEAMRNQQLDAEEITVWYLTNLLTDYSRSERLFDVKRDRWHLPPVAELYAEAADAMSEGERQLLLRRLGDVALFLSGLFSGFFGRRRRLVDVDYYIAMGGRAYGYLCEAGRSSVKDQSLAAVFGQLSAQFARFVDVLAELSETSFAADDQSVLRTYELWAKTGSVRLERRLRRMGIAPCRLRWTH